MATLETWKTRVLSQSFIAVFWSRQMVVSKHDFPGRPLVRLRLHHFATFAAPPQPRPLAPYVTAMRCLCMLYALSTHDSYEIVSISSSFLCMWHAFLSALLMQPVCR